MADTGGGAMASTASPSLSSLADLRKQHVADPSPHGKDAVSVGGSSGIPIVTKPVFGNVPVAPPNKIFDLAARCKADPHPDKLNLGVGAYRDDEGRPSVMSVVRTVEQEMASDVMAGRLDHEYPPMGGSPTLVKATAELVLGHGSSRIVNDHVHGVQAISGTGALRLATEFLGKFHEPKQAIIPDPTWENHMQILQESGISTSYYRYYDESTLGLDMAGMCADLMAAPMGTIVVLHACAHNPTGVDPSQEQWGQLIEICVERQLVVVFDCAYLGFVSGNVDTDAFALRLFAQRGLSFFVCISFSKNFGLYSERCGVTLYVGSSSKEAQAVNSQLKIIGRPMYSVPPMHGAIIVERILTNPALRALWKTELLSQAERILRMRRLLYEGLSKKDPGRDWSHVVAQTGMFTYTGLSKAQCDALIKEHHVYLLDTGRINVCGIPLARVDYLVDAIMAVVNVKPQDAESVAPTTATPSAHL